NDSLPISRSPRLLPCCCAMEPAEVAEAPPPRLPRPEPRPPAEPPFPALGPPLAVGPTGGPNPPPPLPPAGPPLVPPPPGGPPDPPPIWPPGRAGASWIGLDVAAAARESIEGDAGAIPPGTAATGRPPFDPY